MAWQIKSGGDWRGPLSVAILVACLALAWTCAIIGVDFGLHWDEPMMINALSSGLRTGVLLPGWYSYPSVTYDLLLLQAIPDMAADLPAIKEQLGLMVATPVTGLPAAADAVMQSDFLLRARVVFAAITFATAIWVFLKVRVLGRPKLEAALAAALLLSTWELGYHARWVAPDGILMQFAGLALLLILVAVKSQGRNLMWLHAAAAAVGLTVGSKFPGGIMILPLAMAAFMIIRARNPELTVRAILLKTAPVLTTCGLATVLVFVLTTPGVVATPLNFARDVKWEMQHYANGHYGNTVGRGIEHGALILQYLGTEVFSTWPLLAFALAIAAVAGAVDFVRKDRMFAILMLIAPAIYLLYFANQRVMLVRNLMVVLPVFAILAARGLAWGLAIIRRQDLRYAAAGVIVLAVGANFGWLMTAALSVAPQSEQAMGSATARFVRDRASETFHLSDSVRASLGADIPANVVTDPAKAANFVIRSNDHPEYEMWVNGNRPGTYTIVAGAIDVNWDYYPAWVGRPHYIAVSVDQARQMGLVKP